MKSNSHLKCIFCDNSLAKENEPEEHIIPENIGGKLKSRTIVCSKCNNKFGREIDQILLEKFLVIDTYLGLKKKRKRTKKLKGTYKGELYILPQLGPPEIVPQKTGIKLIFSSEESAKRYLKRYGKRLERVGGFIDVEKMIKGAERIKYDFGKPIIITAEGDSDKIWRCCAKIIYEFLFLIDRTYKPSTRKISDMVLGKLDIKDYPICLGNVHYTPIDRDSDHLYHSIIIEGREKDNLFIGYLEIYGALYILLILDEVYKGADFLRGYSHDLMENTYGYINPTSNIPIASQVLKDLINDCSQNNVLYLVQSLQLRNTTNLAFLKSRYYPIKELLMILRTKIVEGGVSFDINTLTEILQKIETSLSNRGINIDAIEQIKGEDRKSELIEKIIKSLEISKHFLYYIGLNTKFINDLNNYFLKPP